MKVRSVLALGGNLGDRRKTIKSAIRAIKSLDGVTLISKSPLVESHALTEGGLDQSKPNYLNGVVEIETDMKPGDLLDAVRKIEQDHGRIRLERWGSRTLDIDIITYGNLIKSGKRLELPHPRAFQRSFVLVPWALMNPSAVLLGHGKVADLAEPLKHEVWISE
jgi:2-amino-4-hydroxy-6-hydroxymethyldihydropteridine diphosphokinase